MIEKKIIKKFPLDKLIIREVEKSRDLAFRDKKNLLHFVGGANIELEQSKKVFK